MSEPLKPAPAHAAAIWIEGDQICLSLPPDFNEDWGHTIRFPVRDEAWLAVTAILKERARESRRVIGTYAAPVQYDADKILKKLIADREAEGKITVIPCVRKTKADDNLSLEDLGL